MSEVRIIDLTGQRFGRLSVLEQVRKPNSRGGSYWRCLCDCGNHSTIHGNNLRRGLVRSCGCLKRELRTTHGYSNKPGKTRVYRIWSGMKQRCQNPNSDAYRMYGARGIKVCDRWQKFENFLADMGEPPKGMSLDRINPAGNYEPGNCRWADSKTQGRNRRRPGELAIADLTINQLETLLAKKRAAEASEMTTDADPLV